MSERRVWNIDVSKMGTRDTKKFVDDMIKKYRKELSTEITEQEREEYINGVWKPKDVTRND